jgi:mono/diheme cytochrome c family protein
MIVKIFGLLILMISAGAGDTSSYFQPGVKSGKEVYQKRCLFCHQADGSGVPGMFPPLIGTPKVLGAPDSLIRIVISGLKGPTELKGVTYRQAMPAVGNISDEEITAVLNYVRTSWGNKAKEITTENVKNVRAQTVKAK